MTNLDIFNLFKQQYEEIDGNLLALKEAIRKEVPSEQISARVMQLTQGWDHAHLNYMHAGNMIFDANNAEIKKLSEDLKDAQAKIHADLQHLQQVAKTLDQITNAVAIATSLLGLGTPRVRV